MEPREQQSREFSFERRVTLFTVLAPLPSVVIALVLIGRTDFTRPTLIALYCLVLAAWFAFAFTFRQLLVRPIQTLSNLLSALREGDLSIRARGARPDDALGLALMEINSLGETLRNQRVGAQEASTLLLTVIDEIDVAVLAFDDDGRVRLANRAAQRLLGLGEPELLGKPAAELGLEFCLEGEAPRTISQTFTGGAGRWELRRSTFRQGGRPHRLIVLADVTRALREEELQAWQRLIRVLSHELNNSLAPIRSIAGSLRDQVRGTDLTDEDRDDLRQGLTVIGDRSAALSRFIAAYARLARLPEPRPDSIDVGSWIPRIAALESRLPVQVSRGPDVTLRADEDQLDQLLINLIRNAVDATVENGGRVEIGWDVRDDLFEVWVLDEGPGISEATNLFVPFFTTKPNGSGIGLALSRQIAEAHGGTLVLEDREGGKGARARLVMPVAGPGAG